MYERIMDLLKSFLSYGDQFYKRLFLVLIAIKAVQHNLMSEYNKADEYISCLRMYFSGTSDPFLSIFEVRSVLYANFNILNKLHLFDEYSQVFDNIMPECPATVEPRKLSHLARVQIRQSLKMSKLPLPVAIEKLHLPEIVKSFIVGDLIDFSSKMRNVSTKSSVTKSELEKLLFGRPTF